MLDIVGKDNKIDPEDPDGYMISGGQKKNELRAEIRERIKQLSEKNGN